MTQTGKAALYWRRSPRVSPGVMTLENGELSFATADRALFRAPVSAVRAEFSTYSTLTVHIPGARHVFVTGAYAGAYAPPFSPQKIAELAGDADAAAAQQEFADGAVIMVSSTAVRNASDMAGSSNAASAGLAGAAGSAIGIVGGVIAVKKLYSSQADSFALAKAWAEFLEANGVAVLWKGSTFGRSQVGITIGVIVGIAVLTAGVYALLRAWQG